MNPDAPSDENDPPGVYIFVFIFFVLCVVLLALLSRAFA